jgi:hypothetical protein
LSPLLLLYLALAADSNLQGWAKQADDSIGIMDFAAILNSNLPGLLWVSEIQKAMPPAQIFWPGTVETEASWFDLSGVISYTTPLLRLIG